MKRIFLTGGGTGGHTMPLIAVYEALKKKGDYQFLGLGSNLGEMPFESKNVFAGKLRRFRSGFSLKRLLKNILDLFKIPLGVLQSIWHIFSFMPSVCFAKGGYASVPVVLTCRLFFIPVIIHESDTIPGLSNRFLAKLAKKVCLSFEKSKKFFPKNKVVYTGNPVRQEILRAEEDLVDFQNDKPCVLIIGGSQGAQRINYLVEAILPRILEKANVIHQTGQGKDNDLKFPNYKQLAFIKNMGRAYHQADVVVSRAGANSLAEIGALKKPAVLIPLPTSSFGHQKENAYVFARASGAIVLEEEHLGPHLLLENIFELLDEPLKAKKMGENAFDVNPPRAAEKIADIILDMA